MRALPPPVSYSSVSLHDLVVAAWGGEFNAPDHGAYQFSNGRRFDSSDKAMINRDLAEQGISQGGIYGVNVPNYLVVENDTTRRQHDMAPPILDQETPFPFDSFNRENP